jgi:hypothetical protein
MIIAKFILWAKQRTPLKNGAPTFLNYMVTSIWWPWKT